jgi:hypothetical protein
MKNDGKKYERFVADLQKAIFESEQIIGQKNIEIELNKKLTDNCGNIREFDLYWEYELEGLIYKTIIECKDYNSDISIDKIAALIGKIKDLPDLKPVFATKVGYQKGAKLKATQNKIDLLVIREQNETDWEDDQGNPYIKNIGITIQFNFPARITKFTPLVDGKWVMTNTSIDITKPLNFSERNDQIIVDDIDKGIKYSLYDLEHKLPMEGEAERGQFEKEEKFSNAFIYYGDMKLKLVGYKVEYTKRKPMECPVEIDLSKNLVGVIEYLQRGTKKPFLKVVMFWKKNLKEDNIFLHQTGVPLPLHTCW